MERQKVFQQVEVHCTCNEVIITTNKQGKQTPQLILGPMLYYTLWGLLEGLSSRIAAAQNNLINNTMLRAHPIENNIIL